MTKYLLGECDSRIASIGSDDNSFRPSFQHVFTEQYPSTYIRVVNSLPDGKMEYIYYDLSSHQYVSKEVINSLNKDTIRIIETDVMV